MYSALRMRTICRQNVARPRTVLHITFWTCLSFNPAHVHLRKHSVTITKKRECDITFIRVHALCHKIFCTVYRLTYKLVHYVYDSIRYCIYKASCSIHACACFVAYTYFSGYPRSHEPEKCNVVFCSSYNAVLIQLCLCDMHASLFLFFLMFGKFPATYA